MQPDPAIVNRWSGAAPFWEKHRETIRQMFAPVTDALIAEASIARGHTVLDVATGPGEPALSIAGVVGPAGKVVGVDLVPGMVEAARRAADQLRIGNAQFEVAPADRLPFPSGSFDAVVSRFGVMFFPSPVDGAREMLRVLKPGGRLALAAWHTPESNPFFYTFARVLDRYVESPPPAPDDPDAFRFAMQGKLRDVLVKAGATSPSERLFKFPIQAPLQPAECWSVRREMSEKVREKVAQLTQEQLLEVNRQILESLREYATAEGVSFPAEVVIVSGSTRAGS